MATTVRSLALKSELKDETKEKRDLEIISQLSELLENYKRTRSLLVRKNRSLTEFAHLRPVSDGAKVCHDGVDATSYEISFGVTLNKVDTAEEITPTRAPDPRFEGNRYHIAFRHGEYHAQKDKAMAAILRCFLGHAPDIDIIQDKEDFYVASRTIKNFKQGLRDYIIDSEGNLTEKGTGKPFKLKGLGSIAAIDYFFGSDDVHDGNWGTQQQGEYLVAYRIDSADILDTELLEIPMTEQRIASLPHIKRDVVDKEEESNIYHMSVPVEIVRSKEYQEEILTTLRKIASTDFSIIKDILKRNIDTAPIDEGYWMLNWALPRVKQGPEALAKECKETLEECTRWLKELEAGLPNTLGECEQLEKLGFDGILDLLEKRHNQLKVLFKIAPTSIPDPLIFSGTVGPALLELCAVPSKGTAESVVGLGSLATGAGDSSIKLSTIAK